ncbi:MULTISPECIES: hypothetical protein [unclassified Sulfitobacter]|nr:MULTISPECIES: hypothetical protein [unclassified Sulfitobacter]MBO9440405.1 hypothetical protein [Sulfitobacter sp. R18_2]
MPSHFEFLDPEIGFTSAVITDPNRFVGRADLIENSVRAINTTSSLVTVFGKRGVGKSSLLRQIQLMSTGDYEIAERSGLAHLVPKDPKKYYTVFYTCDSQISNIQELLLRICTDTDAVDGLLRLVPDKGKELVEFSRAQEESASLDLKVLKWGGKGHDAEKYAASLKADIIQTFRNFCSSVVEHNNRWWRKRDGLIIFLDEFDVIEDKSGIGSLIKSLSSSKLKFAISGIADDLSSLVEDHGSVERLIEQGYAHVKPMALDETALIFRRASAAYHGKLVFSDEVISKIFDISMGYPYFTQLIGKRCVEQGNLTGTNNIEIGTLNDVLEEISSGRAFPHLERKYQRAVGDSNSRALLLTLLAEENVSLDDVEGGISLKAIRTTAQELDIEYMDQLVPRLIDKKYGPALVRKHDQRGTYEFLDPVFRAYVRLRK